MASHSLLVTIPLDSDQQRLVERELPAGITTQFLDELDPAGRETAVVEADAILSWLPQHELSDEEFSRLHGGQLLQAVAAGVDQLPLGRLPEGLVLQSNAGAYAEPMAEHVLAMYLALFKRLRIEHEKLREGEFDQFRSNRRVQGSTCGILGFGATGQAAARLLKPIGVSIHAINRHGAAEEAVEFLGTPGDLEDVMRAVDGLVIAAPLTPDTAGIIDREKLDWMAEDAMIINVARGELIDQHDLFHHLRDNPAFQAGIDAWWVEPVRHGRFELEYPFLELPNVVGSPHNSAQVPDAFEQGIRRAVGCLVNALTTGEYVNRVDRDVGY